MIKLLLLSIFFGVWLSATTVATQPSFSHKFVGIKKSMTNGTYASFKKYQRKQAGLAVVRGDVLSNIYNGEHKFKSFQDYTIIAQMSDSYIYLVTKDFLVSSIYDLRGKTIAVGSRNNLAASYIMRVAEKYGVAQEINIKAIDELKAIKELNVNNVDALFVFASKRYIKTLKGLNKNNIPNDFITVLNKQTGLNKISSNGVMTMKASNYVIASNDIDYDELRLVVQNLKKKRVKILKSVNPKIGMINSYISTILADMKESNNNKEFVKVSNKPKVRVNTDKMIIKENLEFNFLDKSMNANKMQLYYQFVNNTNKPLKILFKSIETKSFDNYPFKSRHIIRINQPNLNIEAKSKKMFHIEVLRKESISIAIDGNYLFEINGEIKRFKFSIKGDK